MKNKIAILNFFSTLFYFSVCLFLTWNISGGDIALIFIYLISLFIHLTIIIVIFFKKKEKLISALCGIAIAMILSFLIYKIIDYKKGETQPKVETSKSNFTNPQRIDKKEIDFRLALRISFQNFEPLRS
jgi:uncharacterized membrane protein